MFGEKEPFHPTKPIINLFPPQTASSCERVKFDISIKVDCISLYN
nr:MAG TPA: hypothetical protein [Caudoviricetes sp.]